MNQSTPATRRHLRTRGTTRRRSGGAVKLNPEAATAILTPIYAALPVTRAAGTHNLTYAEIEWPTLKAMVDYIETQSWQNGSTANKFYDLGSGRGRAVLYMGLSGLFEMSVGVEVLPERIALAQQALTRLKASIPTAGSKVRLYEASFLNPAFKYKDARVIFLSNDSFDTETQTALFSKLETEMPKGSLLFCSRMPLPLPGAFEKLGQISEIHILKHL